MTKEKTKTGIIIILSALIIVLGTVTVSALSRGDVKTAYIEKALAEEIVDNTDGTIRIKINPEINIKNGVMQDLYFANYNESRYLECKIKVDDKYVYDSDFVETGDIIVGDFIKTDGLSKGRTEAVAEIYSYDLAKKKVSQTNVEVALNM